MSSQSSALNAQRNYSFLGLLFCLIWGAYTAQAQAGLPDFTELAEKQSRAVVNISIQQKAPNRKQTPEILQHFFGDQFRFEAPPNRSPRQHSLGSGFIISSDGYILSNNHVIAGADKVMVRLNDRRELEAQVIGTDPRSDIALLKINAKNLPIVKMGNSEKLKVGEWVVAIGSPFGFDYSVTAGIVSAKGRPLPGENYVPFIQTDVAINPGNSGGPLFNLNGEVVGINSQIYSRTGGFMGMSFSIPINVVQEVVEQLKEQGYVKRGWLGVVIQDINQDLAESFGLDKPAGALISQVYPGSPAEKSGLQEGDIVIAYDGKPVSLSAELPHYVGRSKVGQEVDMVVVRQGKTLTVELEIGELEPDENSPPVVASKPQSPKLILGAQIANIPPERLKGLTIKAGVVVKQIDAGPLQKAGLRPGDIITALNNTPISSVKELRKVVKKIPHGKWVPMKIQRKNGPQFIAVYIPED